MRSVSAATTRAPVAPQLSRASMAAWKICNPAALLFAGCLLQALAVTITRRGTLQTQSILLPLRWREAALLCSGLWVEPDLPGWSPFCLHKRGAYNVVKSYALIHADKTCVRIRTQLRTNSCTVMWKKIRNGKVENCACINQFVNRAQYRTQLCIFFVIVQNCARYCTQCVQLGLMCKVFVHNVRTISTQPGYVNRKYSKVC